MEIAIDSRHLAQTIRLNFPTDRQQFQENLLDSEETNSQIPAGRPIGPGQHLRIEGPSPQSDGAEGQAVTTASTSGEPTRLALVSTIQFVAALARLKDDLTAELDDPSGRSPEPTGAAADRELEISRPKLFSGKYEATIPRSKPLSPGEILGCTSPHLNDDVDAIL